MDIVIIATGSDNAFKFMSSFVLPLLYSGHTCFCFFDGFDEIGVAISTGLGHAKRVRPAVN
jgi:hypothetical protein